MFAVLVVSVLGFTAIAAVTLYAVACAPEPYVPVSVDCQNGVHLGCAWCPCVHGEHRAGHDE